MRAIKQFNTTSPSLGQLVEKINRLVKETNSQKEEIRQIKSKLRVNTHYTRK